MRAVATVLRRGAEACGVDRDADALFARLRSHGAMSQPESDEITRCLQQMEAGDEGAAHRLLAYLYEDLRSVAGQVFGSRRELTIQPTALVHDAYLRLVKTSGGGWSDRKHFMRVAALAMRQVLTDYVRGRNAEKRGGGDVGVALGEDLEESVAEVDCVDLVALHDALEKLRGLDARQAEIVELRFFSGLTVEEVASVMGLVERTVYRDWKMARSWFQRELGLSSKG